MNYKHFILVPFLSAATLLAQESAPELPTPQLPQRGTVIFIVPAKVEAERAIEIAEASVHTRLVGPLAETTVTLVFHNPNSRDMEGELSYPLPPDATLQGYALDVNGKMVDGVPVPKQKARVAFEGEQRQGVDPGLAEWSGGNRFKTRISPIPAQGQRTVRLRYTTMVQQNGQSASYRLPLDFEKVGTFRLRVEAVSKEQPQVQPSGLGNLAFTPWQSQFVLEREWKNLALREDLVIDLPQGMADAPAVEKHENVFYLAKLVTPPQSGPSTLPTPDTLELVWDASASMEMVDKAPLFETLRLYFASRADKPCTVRCTVVREDVCPAVDFRVEQGNATELLEFLRTLPYGGATGDISAAMQGDTPLRLLVTDGVVNFADKTSSAPARGLTYALVASSGVDKAALRRWGATPLDLLSQTPQQALAHVPAMQLAGVECNGKPCESALTSAPGGVVDGTLLLTDMMIAGRYEYSLLFRSAAGEQRVSFAVDTAEAVEGQLNRSFHAQNRLAALLLEPDTPARSVLLRRLGEEFGIVTPGTSLLVLENLEQYLRYEVRPPACCPELRAQYDARIAERSRFNAEDKERELREQKESALNQRRALLRWYEKDFPRESAPSPKASGTVVRRAASRAVGSAVAPSVVVSGSARRAPINPEEADALWEEPSPCEEVEDEEEDAFMAEDGGTADEEDGDEREAISAAPTVAPVTMVAEEEEDEEGDEDSSEPPPAPAPAPVTVELASRASEAPQAPAEEEPAIRMQAWNANAPYIAAIKAAAEPIAAYHGQRREHAASPGFYLDCADFFEKSGNRAFAVHVLSNLLEMDAENRSLMRAAAYKLRYMGEAEKSIILFRKVLELFPEEPQSYRDLGLALADAGRWQEAVDTLKLVLEKPMDERFRGMEQIALVEMANIVARAHREGKPVETGELSTEYLKPIEADLRVVINWDTDLSDMDLWVTDPGREKCYYSHQLTRSGGRISRDVTGGYGPEEFLIRQALPGDYKVEAHYFGSRSMKMLAPVTLYAELYTDYGRPTEKRQTLIFRLDGRDQIVHIADFAHGSDPAAPATRDYQVRAGESWESIAERELGSAARAAEIVALNPGAKAEEQPSTGAVIRLPKH